MPDWAFWAIGGVVGAAGLALGAWALFWDRARGRRRCPRCWYDMAGVAGLRCPECGREARSEKKFFRTRRRWRWAVAAFALLALGASTAVAPRFRRHGAMALVPMPVLRAMAMRFEDEGATLFVQHESQLVPGVSGAPKVGPWQRALIASHIARRLQQVSGVDPQRHDPHLAEAERTRLMMALWQLPHEARVAAPELRKLLHSGNDADWQMAAWVLIEIGSCTGDVEDRLFGIVQDSYALPRRRAVAITLMAGEFGRKGWTLARDACDDAEAEVRARAIRSLPEWKEYTQDTTIVLERMIEQCDRSTKQMAVESLITMQEDCIPFLSRMLGSTDDDAKVSILGALEREAEQRGWTLTAWTRAPPLVAKASPTSMARMLARALAHGNSYAIRARTAEVLVAYGATSQEAAAVVFDAVAANEPLVIEACVRWLETDAPIADDNAEHLIRALCLVDKAKVRDIAEECMRRRDTRHSGSIGR